MLKNLVGKIALRSENSLPNSEKWSTISKFVAYFSLFRSEILLLKRIYFFL